MNSSKARSSRKETYTHKNIDPEINTTSTMYIHHNNIQNNSKKYVETAKITAQKQAKICTEWGCQVVRIDKGKCKKAVEIKPAKVTKHYNYAPHKDTTGSHLQPPNDKEHQRWTHPITPIASCSTSNT